jgi:hypothetical protein
MPEQRAGWRPSGVYLRGHDSRVQHAIAWAPFKTMEIVRGQPQPGVDVNGCLDDIAQFGVHVTDAYRRITEEAIG